MDTPAYFQALVGLVPFPVADISTDFILMLDPDTKAWEVIDFGRESRSAETASRNKNVSGVVAADSGIRVEGEGSESSR